jgi:peptidoglycan hydrolase CwlO-like protein
METASTQVQTGPLTLKDVQKHIFIAILVAVTTGIIAGVGTGIGVYYKTVDKVEEHTSIISKLTDNVNTITVMVNDLKTQTAVASISPAYQQKQIDGLSAKMDKLDDKLDKIQESLNRK